MIYEQVDDRTCTGSTRSHDLDVRAQAPCCPVESQPTGQHSIVSSAFRVERWKQLHDHPAMMADGTFKKYHAGAAASLDMLQAAHRLLRKHERPPKREPGDPLETA